MTSLIKQLSGNDCVLAAIAMARGAAAWHDLWTAADLDAVIKSKGVSGYDTWLARAGFEPRHFREIQVWQSSDQSLLRQLLWRRRALLSVHSLNIDQGHHMVFWDGSEVFDPSTQRTYCWLHSMQISRVVLLEDAGLLPVESKS